MAGLEMKTKWRSKADKDAVEVAIPREVWTGPDTNNINPRIMVEVVEEEGRFGLDRVCFD